MAKRILLLFLLLLIGRASVAQGQQDAEFLGLDAGSYTPGSWINVRWRVTHVDTAILELYDAQSNALINLLYLPTEGVQEVYIPPTAVNGVRFVLWSALQPTRLHTDEIVLIFNRLRSQTLSLPSSVAPPVTGLTPAAPCQPTFYFPGKSESNCLTMLQGRIPATYQPFENGFMLWRRDMGDVWVMEKSGLSLSYSESLYGLMADNPITDTPPKGRSTPANGFGRVWGNVEEVRKALGWALGPEVGYVMTVQYALDSSQIRYSYMTLPDDQVVKIFDGVRWTFETES